MKDEKEISTSKLNNFHDDCSNQQKLFEKNEQINHNNTTNENNSSAK